MANRHDVDESEVEGHASNIVRHLDTWKLGAAFLLLAVVLLSLFSLKLWSDLNETVDEVDVLLAARLEEARAADKESVARCFSSATQGPVLRRVLLSLERETMDAQAKADLHEFRRLSLLNTPTLLDCRKLAKRLGVAVPQEGRS